MWSNITFRWWAYHRSLRRPPWTVSFSTPSVDDDGGLSTFHGGDAGVGGSQIQWRGSEVVVLWVSAILSLVTLAIEKLVNLDLEFGLPLGWREKCQTNNFLFQEKIRGRAGSFTFLLCVVEWNKKSLICFVLNLMSLVFYFLKHFLAFLSCQKSFNTF